jgi:hypothetical protein
MGTFNYVKNADVSIPFIYTAYNEFWLNQMRYLPIWLKWFALDTANSSKTPNPMVIIYTIISE